MYEFLIVFSMNVGLIISAASKNEAWKKALAMGISDEDIEDVRFYRAL